MVDLHRRGASQHRGLLRPSLPPGRLLGIAPKWRLDRPRPPECRSCIACKKGPAGAIRRGPWL